MAKASEPALKKYTAVFGIKHDGKRYKAGATVEMTPEQAEPLVRRGSLVEVGGSAVSPNADMNVPATGTYKELENAAPHLTADPAEA